MEPYLQELLKKVGQWGYDRNLLAPENLKSQTFKLVSEFGEIGAARIERDKDALRDGIGDTLVVCIILGHQLNSPITEADFDAYYNAERTCTSLAGPLGSLGLFADIVLKGGEGADANLHEFARRVIGYARYCCEDPVDCLTLAYEEIKDRKGVMYNGAFIKEADPRYAEVMQELGRVAS